MTNGKAFQNLSQEEKEQFMQTYNDYPLKDYVDWQSYYDSGNGNALDFVVAIAKGRNEDGNLVFVLDEFSEDDMDYKLIYVCEENAFYKVADNPDEVGDFIEGGEPIW